jgi:hypothetical protein
VALVDFPEFAKRHPRSARAIVRSVVRLRMALPEELRDPHGWPRLASCADVQGDSRKVAAVAREVYSDLCGLEDSRRSITGRTSTISVKDRFPDGGKDLEQTVAEICREAAPDAKPFWVAWDRIGRELELHP